MFHDFQDDIITVFKIHRQLKTISTLNSSDLRRFVASLTLSCFSNLGVLRAAKAFLCTMYIATSSNIIITENLLQQ